ncbi:MAG: HAMP domain-containing sensor histidine kinase [Sphingorhabdus sp.]
MSIRLNSLRVRFLTAILLWVVLGIGAIWYSSVRLFSMHVEAQYHEELEVHVKELAGLMILDASGKPHLTRPLSDPRYAVPLSGFYWQVTRPGFGTVKSPSMTRGGLEYDFADSPDILHHVANGPTGKTIVYGLVRAASSGAPTHFVIATDERHLQRIIAVFTQELTVWLALLALALITSGLAIITFGLRPFGTLARSIRDLRVGNAAAITGSYPDEIQEVVTDLNAYAGRNAAIVERARVQAGNLAHSLRTPLAVITDEAECMMEAGKAGKQAQVFLDQTHAMQRQIDYHLARARSGGSRQAIGAQTVLSEVLSPLLSAMERIYPAKSFGFAVASGTAAIIACDPEDLNEILCNLLDNAGKWAARNISIRFHEDGERSVIEIEDDGPGVEQDCLERAFEIGVSLGEDEGSSGLGLAISRDIARDYGGDVTLGRAAKRGLIARMVIPRVL